MKNSNPFSSRKRPIKLAECTSFEISKEDSDMLFGGFKEYVPPIYEQDSRMNPPFKVDDLLIDINQKRSE